MLSWSINCLSFFFLKQEILNKVHNNTGSLSFASVIQYIITYFLKILLILSPVISASVLRVVSSSGKKCWLIPKWFSWKKEPIAKSDKVDGRQTKCLWRLNERVRVFRPYSIKKYLRASAERRNILVSALNAVPSCSHQPFYSRI